MDTKPRQNQDSSICESHLFVLNQKDTLEKLKAGAITDLRVSASYPADQIVLHALKLGTFQSVLKSFPDPRKNFEVPIDMLLLPQILQRLHDEHSLLLAPYMLNNAELVERLGYNAEVLEKGFNQRNSKPRETAFHGETLKHVLLSLQPELITRWFNGVFKDFICKEAPGRTRQYILDGTKIEVPRHLAASYQRSGMVEDQYGEKHYGYKAVWLQEIIDKKGVIVALKIVPIERHDLDVGRELVAEFDFELGSTLLMDRGFIDGAWITHLKQDRKIDVVIPLKKNMHAVTDAIAIADERGLWKPHPTRSGQQVAEIGDKPGDLLWKDCPVLSYGVLCRWMRKDGKQTEVLFVTTQSKSNGKKILATYDQRAEIEESHRQMKMFQGLEKIPSKKFTQVLFRIIMGVVGYNLLSLFLNSEKCETLEQYSLKTMRQRRPVEKNAKIIIYSESSFAILRFYELLPILMRLKGRVKERVITLIESLDPSSIPF